MKSMEARLTISLTSLYPPARILSIESTPKQGQVAQLEHLPLSRA